VEHRASELVIWTGNLGENKERLSQGPLIGAVGGVFNCLGRNTRYLSLVEPLWNCTVYWKFFFASGESPSRNPLLRLLHACWRTVSAWRRLLLQSGVPPFRHEYPELLTLKVLSRS